MAFVLVLLAALGLPDAAPDPLITFGPATTAPAVDSTAPRAVAAPVFRTDMPILSDRVRWQPSAAPLSEPPPPQRIQLPPSQLKTFPRQKSQRELQAELAADEAVQPQLHPYNIYELAALSLAQVPADRQYEARFLTQWPLPDTEAENLDKALRFWCASLSNRRQYIPPTRVPGLGWIVYLSDYDWDASAWDELATAKPYFAVSVLDHHYHVHRGWLDPQVEHAVREATYSSVPIVRADYFLGRTGVEVGDGGYYSKFLRLPDNENALFKKFGVDEKFIHDNYLTRGGAVLHSIVARNNRELQLLPSLYGLDQRFIWRSLDTRSSADQSSVLDHFQGTIQFAGKEFIGTNKNGTHFYFLANNKNKQLPEVPIDVAQDHDDPHEARVMSPYKCVSCHGPKGGIRGFEDAITRIAMSKDVGLAVITKEPTFDPEVTSQHRPPNAHPLVWRGTGAEIQLL